MENVEQLAAAWVEYMKRRDPATGDLRDVESHDLLDEDDAATALVSLEFSDPATAFEVVDRILTSSSDPWILANLGAGPIETLLVNGGAGALEKVRQLRENHVGMIEVARNVYTSSLSKEATTLITKIASGRFDARPAR